VTITAIAMVAVLVCNSLSVGPPGAYMIALGCAAGTGLGAAGTTAWHAGLLVLGGGVLAWAVHMSGASCRRVARKGPRLPPPRPP
jgi:hypothetical protein